MPLVLFLVFSLSCLLIKQVEFAVPMYCESHWITCYVDDAFERSYLCMPRSRFYSHRKISEGGPPCYSMPLVQRGLTISSLYCLLILARHCLSKIMLLFCLGGSRQSLKVFVVKCIPRRPCYYMPCPI